MLEGKASPARQRTMDLFVHYGDALGAERRVATNNACGTNPDLAAAPVIHQRT